MGGRERKKQQLAEVDAKKAEIEQVKVELEEKRLLKEAAEVPEKEALDKIKAEEDRLKQLREEEDKLEREKEALVCKKRNVMYYICIYCIYLRLRLLDYFCRSLCTPLCSCLQFMFTPT